MSEIKPFARQGHYTAVDNTVFDEVMPSLSNSEWKVICLIIRKTVGWQKHEDDISYSQIAAGTGIKAPATISKALDGLRKKGLLIVSQGDKWQANSYRLNRDYKVTTSENEPTSKNEVASTSKNEVASTSKNEDTKEKEIKIKEKDSLGHSEIFNAYQNNIGELTKTLSDSIQEAINTYPSSWIIDAIVIAAEKKVRKWSYIEGILRNWKVEGRGDKQAESETVSAWEEVKQTVVKGGRPSFSDDRILESVRPIWPELQSMNQYNERELRAKFERNYNAIN